MRYFVKTPGWLRSLYPRRLWRVDTKEKIIYLSFDDGPHPVATPFVLDMLKRYDAKASFFCIGKNVVAHPNIYQRILDDGHVVGNHTQQHLNGWKTTSKIYLNDVREAAQHIHSGLFRPPYGRLKGQQAKQISSTMGVSNAKIVMWDVLSGDFDESIDGPRCLQNVVRNAGRGSIIVFHDSTKAWPRLQYVLPAAMEFFCKAGYRFESIK